MPMATADMLDTAQMPQILQQAGIDTAVVWRGVPAAIDSHSFVWEAPDGPP